MELPPAWGHVLKPRQPPEGEGQQALPPAWGHVLKRFDTLPHDGEEDGCPPRGGMY